ncbi:MAG: hypothetical protein JXR70_19735 [Spirochaetales bacterium]|nr:hypothetical protein [Spirochaetales bacterium]
MNMEFHYYMIYYLALSAGYDDEESYVIANSSQLVDHNCTVYTINEGKPDSYSNYISQTMDITNPVKKLMRVYLCFHFFPGDIDAPSANRKDGKLHLLNTTPNSPNVEKMLDEALATGNLYRIGIALHAYADTWCHQNFVGTFDHYNTYNDTIRRMIPGIGHACALTHPDMVSLLWEDDRLVNSQRLINNNQRILEAGFHVFRKLKAHKSAKTDDGVQKDWEPIKNQLQKIMGGLTIHPHVSEKGAKSRVKKYKELLKPNNFREYNRNQWFDQAVIRKIRFIKDKATNFGTRVIFPDRYSKKPDFETSHWYRFQEGIKEHQAASLKILDSLFQRMELDSLYDF